MSNREKGNQGGHFIRGYKILGILSGGEAGATLKALDPRLGRQVVLLALKPSTSSQPQVREQFFQETDTASRSGHPGVARVYEVGRADPVLFVVLEYLPGPNLHTLMKQLHAAGQRVGVAEAVRLVYQLSQAVEHIYQSGVGQYGFSPEIVGLRPRPADGLSYRPILLDPGISILCQAGLARSLLVYLSPQSLRGESAGARGDVYALGILLFELLTGQPPFKIEHREDAARFFGQEYRPSPRALRPDLPAAVEDIVVKALAKQPEERFASPGELAGALAELLQKAPFFQNEPTQRGEASPIFAALRSSLGELKEPGETLADLSNDVWQPDLASAGSYVQILEPGGKERKVTLGPAGLTIGRDSSNDIVLDDPKISRHHARVDFDGYQYTVRDLNSKNGTYVGNLRIEPDRPQAWPEDRHLRLGGSWLSLQTRNEATLPPREGASHLEDTQTAPIDLTQSAPFDMTQAASRTQTAGFGQTRQNFTSASRARSAVGGHVGLTIDTPKVSATPGSPATAVLVLHNRGYEEDTFRLSVEGVSQDWITSLPKMVRMPPRARQEVKLVILPPRSPESRAAHYNVMIRVSSLKEPLSRAIEKMTLFVTAYADLDSRLEPAQVEAGGLVQVTVANRGNAPEKVTVAWEGEGLVFEPPRIDQALKNGLEFVAGTRVNLVQPRLVGGEQVQPFNTKVSASNGQAQTLSGSVVSRGRVPPWFPAAAGILLATVMGCIFLGILLWVWPLGWVGKGVAEDYKGTQVAVATETAMKIAKETKKALDESDADNDGLTYKDEIEEYKTDPNNPDTDNDKLRDKKELKEHTDPLIPDTDGDGVLDGVEVDEGTDPTKPDRNVTQTPTPTGTSAASATPTPPRTATLTPTPSESPSNDAPEIKIPALQRVNEEQELVFSSPNGSQIRIDDRDAGKELVFVNLTVTEGTLTLNSRQRLSFTTGDGTDDQALAFTGALEDINKALDGMKYKPPVDFAATTKLSIIMDDQGHTGEGGAKGAKEILEIEVRGINDAPYFTKGGDITVDDNSRQVIKTGWATNIQAGPYDERMQKLIFILTTSNDSLFVIPPAVDPVNGHLSFTPAQNASGKVEVNVRLKDDGGTNSGGVDISQAQSFNIVFTRPTHAPTDLLLNSTILPENGSAGAPVGVFSAADADPGETFSYLLVNGDGSADNSAFTISGNELRAGGPFDFEVKNSLSIRVRVTDSTRQFFEKRFTVTVGNLNEPPEAVDDSATSAGQPIVIDVLANDREPDGQPLSIVKLGVPITGTATLFENRVVYTPTIQFTGAVFTYTVSDGFYLDTAQVTVQKTQQAWSEDYPFWVGSPWLPFKGAAAAENGFSRASVDLWPAAPFGGGWEGCRKDHSDINA